MVRGDPIVSSRALAVMFFLAVALVVLALGPPPSNAVLILAVSGFVIWLAVVAYTMVRQMEVTEEPPRREDRYALGAEASVSIQYRGDREVVELVAARIDSTVRNLREELEDAG